MSYTPRFETETGEGMRPNVTCTYLLQQLDGRHTTYKPLQLLRFTSSDECSKFLHIFHIPQFKNKNYEAKRPDFRFY